MSRENREISARYPEGYAIKTDLPNTIIGEVLTLIDAIGLPDTQADALKDLIRQGIWKHINNHAVLINSERFTEIVTEHRKKHEKSGETDK